ncbi:MAG TPA: hypothetical protein VFY82_15960 [Acidimicrobiales bacterium]|nr:hypothetical protein [Acidimicrobiales bacterium]
MVGSRLLGAACVLAVGALGFGLGPLAGAALGQDDDPDADPTAVDRSSPAAGTVSEPEGQAESPPGSTAPPQGETTTASDPTSDSTPPEADPVPTAQPILSPTFGPPGTTVTVTQATGGCTDFSVSVGGETVSGETDGSVGIAQIEIPDGMGTGAQAITTDRCGEPDRAMFTVTESVTDTTGDESTTTAAPPSTSVTPTTSVPPPETVEECEQQASEAEARLVYEPRRRMVVDETYEVQAALSLDDLPPDVTFETPTTIVGVPDARCKVAAHLTGPDFTIDPPGPQPQAFIGTRTLVWRWDVRPSDDGDHELTLRVQAEVVEGGRTIPGRTILSEAVIDVDAAPVSFWGRLTGSSRDIFGHPMVPVALVPLVGLGAAAARRRFGHAASGGGGPKPLDGGPTGQRT